MADLFQNGLLVNTSRITLAAKRIGVEWAATTPLAIPPPEDCVLVDPPSDAHVLRRLDALLDPASLPFTEGPRAMVRGCVRPFDTRHIDAAWLTMAADWFPPPAFARITPPTGGTSIDLMIHLHQPTVDLADDEWLAGEFEVVTSTGGLATEHGRITRQDGSLVAESLQTRWTAEG